MRETGEMEVLSVNEVIDESPEITTIKFTPNDDRKWKGLIPGQFLMVWIPGVDEVPMSVSFLSKEPFVMGITVQAIGEATNSLCSLSPGDRIGVRGPYGNGFTLPEMDDIDRIIGVTGGVGAASTVVVKVAEEKPEVILKL